LSRSCFIIISARKHSTHIRHHHKESLEKPSTRLGKRRQRIKQQQQQQPMTTTDKYDRQLRLWGATGQRALAQTCVVLVRATAAGTETLKNLVLPGIGHVAVLDDCDDIGTQYASNFFLVHSDGNKNKSETDGSNSNDSIGSSTKKCRAQQALEHLQELNPDVEGSWTHCTENLVQYDFASYFSTLLLRQSNATTTEKIVVVGSDLEPPLLHKLATVCTGGNISFIAVHSYGMMGIVRLQSPPLALLNPKPRDAPPDLRLTRPFPALDEMVRSICRTALSNHDHAHIPYPIILLQAMHEWKQRSNNDSGPTTYTEKQEFQSFVKSLSRNYDNELNFQEAVRNAYTAYTARELDVDHLDRMAQTAAAATSSCPELHFLLQALQQFLQHHNHEPPVTGTIPDMTASTELYIQLQKVYRDRAEQDYEEMRQLVRGAVSDELVLTFCQNVFSVDLLQTRSIFADNDTIPDEIGEDLAMATMEGDERPDQLPLLWYLGFCACQVFYKLHGRYPGTTDDYEMDMVPLQTCIVQVVDRYKLGTTEVIHETLLKNIGDYATELTRYGNAEIHTIASVVGGVASQEAVKIITGQYVPLNNTYVYNGIASTGAVYKF
jgi:NEDD8-activating enzyme E1 regulatory subunit